MVHLHDYFMYESISSLRYIVIGTASFLKTLTGKTSERHCKEFNYLLTHFIRDFFCLLYIQFWL